MKKTILAASLLAAIPAYCLPTYEPFTEYANLVATQSQTLYVTSNGLSTVPSGSLVGNATIFGVDLGTNGLTAPSGEVWTNLAFAGTSAAGSSTSGIYKGLEVCIISNSSIFTAANLASLLPSTFPGFPAAGGAITNIVENPAQPQVFSNNTYVITESDCGNSPELIFSSPVTRPASGTKSLFVSYLIDVAQAGQLATGNNGRYMAFLSSSNLVEGSNSGGVYTTWAQMFNTFSSTGVHYCGHGLYGGPYFGPTDTSKGLCFTNSPGWPKAAYATPEFIVGEVILTPGGGLLDTNILWLNPPTSAFGGPTPAASSFFINEITNTQGNLAALCLIDRQGELASGGVGTNYIANLLIGSTWSYVTGGPEFTTQPAVTTLSSPGNTVTLNAVATAAGQSVSYQWQRNGNNVNNGANGTGGAATVSGATSTTLTLAGVAGNDGGTYQLVATASSTTYNLTSSNAIVIVSDPGVIAQPSPASTAADAGQTVSFTATVETTSSRLTYAWYNGSSMLVNGTQADGSIAIGAQGTNSSGTVNLTLTLENVACAEDGNYSLQITNASGSTAATTSSSLTVTDPYITVQPPALVGIAPNQPTVIPVVANGTGLTYQWQWNNGNGNNANNGEISGATTSALTISGANTANDAGTYWVTVSGSGCSGSPVQSANAIVVVATTPSGLSVYPPTVTQQVGTHLSLVGTVTGGSGVIEMYLKKNGANLNNGTQPDGSFISGVGTLLTGPGTASMVLSNLTVNDSGTYTMIASNGAGMVTATSTVTISSGFLNFSTNNLVLTRVGDGTQPLSGATGNTLYLDQYTTAGVYVNSTMVPDSGPNGVLVAGGPYPSGNEGAQEAYLTVSSNNEYLNFGGFCYSYPFLGGNNVTVGGTTNVRGIYALNGQGALALVYTNYGLYSGGSGFRSVYSTDGLTNFWTTGSASAGTVKYVNAGPAGAAYTITDPGQGIPGLPGVAAPTPNSGGVVVGQYGTNIIFSDNETDGDATVQNVWGLDEFTGGAPETAPAPYVNILLAAGLMGNPTDFSFSPDGNTVYIADDAATSGSTGDGGIQRYDYYGGVWNWAYNIYDTASPDGTNGCKGLAVYWPPSITSWGQGVEGAVLYATTSEPTNNRIIMIVDNAGGNSTSTTLVTSGPNEFFRGIRFAPKTVPLAIPVPPVSQNVIVGHSVNFNPTVVGNMAYYYPNAAGAAYDQLDATGTTYQWYSNGVPVANATNLSFGIPSIGLSANGSSYTLVVSNRFNGAVTSAPPAVLTVSTFTPTTDLVGWWKLSDGSGANLADSSGYGDTGFMTNFPGNNSEWVAGLDGTDAVNFANADGNADNAILVPDAPQLNFSNNLAFSLAAWIKSSTSNQTNGAGLITKGYGNGGESYDLDLYGNYHRFFVRSGSGSVTAINATANVPPLNEWEHVVATYDGNAGNMALYLNGVLVGNVSVAGSLLPTAYPVSIGARTASSTNIWGPTYDFPFQGEMQDVRIYNVALDASNVATVYNVLAPQITGPSHIVTSPAGSFVAAGQFQFNISGSPNTTYRVWSTTNVALTPVIGKWTEVTSGAFNASGAATVTDSAATGVTKYYTITQP